MQAKSLADQTSIHRKKLTSHFNEMAAREVFMKQQVDRHKQLQAEADTTAQEINN